MKKPGVSDTAIPPVLIETLREARSVTALTGAGVSAQSGLPTFRDAMEGLWAKYDPMELATPQAFERDPALVSRWYDWRRRKCAEARPNAGHLALARLERHLDAHGRSFTLVTQNVDRLHQQAGSRRIVELHGTLWEWRCTVCHRQREEREAPFTEHPPRCACGGVRRPAVVWLGERLPADALQAAARAAETCDLFLSIGTSGAVYPAAGLAELAMTGGAVTVEINPGATPISGRVDHALRGGAAELLPELVGRAFDGLDPGG